MLAPLLFVLYLADLADIVDPHNQVHSIPDDTSCTCVAIVQAPSWKWLGRSSALLLSIIGCLPTESNLTLARLSCFGLGQNTACLSFRVYRTAQTPSWRVSSFSCSDDDSNQSIKFINNKLDWLESYDVFQKLHNAHYVPVQWRCRGEVITDCAYGVSVGRTKCTSFEVVASEAVYWHMLYSCRSAACSFRQMSCCASAWWCSRSKCLVLWKG